MNKLTVAFLALYICATAVYAGSTDTLVFTLQQVITTAKEQAPASKRASTQLKNRYFQYKTYRANNLPALTLNATLPDFNNSITPVVQPDGSVLFAHQNVASSMLSLSVNQNIGWTGGSLFMGSNLNRIDLFSDVPDRSYSSSPIFFGLSQPILRYNKLKWDSRIEPLLYEESQRGYIEEMEEVSKTASNLFFDLLLAQVNKQIADNNLHSNDTLYQISVGRYNLGKIAENELLQMQMGVMNAKTDLAQSTLDVELASIALRNYLNIKGGQRIQLIAPSQIPSVKVDYALALSQAKSNRQDMLSYERQKLEAERDVAIARGNAGFKADIYAYYGLAQSALTFPEAYKHPQESEQLRLGITIPILDWGRGHSQIETAKGNRDITELNVQVAEQSFEQEILLIVNRVQMLSNKAKIAQQNDTIAEKRNDITVKRYLIGKIGITDLNIARDEREKASRDYVAALRDFWHSYYDLRKKTLYDFESNMKIK